MKYGFPSFDNVRSYNNFVLSYDQRTRIPHWVLEHLTPESIQHNPNVDRTLCVFHEDESFHPFFRFFFYINIQYYLKMCMLIL